MGKLKAEWQRTDIPEPVKVKLWLAMKENTSHPSWQQAVARMEFSQEEEKYVRTSYDTYRALKQEIRLMPVSVVEALDNQELRRWILSVRLEPQAQTAPVEAGPPALASNDWSLRSLLEEGFQEWEAAVLVRVWNLPLDPADLMAGYAKSLLTSLREARRQFPGAPLAYLWVLGIARFCRNMGLSAASPEVGVFLRFERLSRRYEPWRSAAAGFVFWDDMELQEEGGSVQATALYDLIRNVVDRIQRDDLERLMAMGRGRQAVDFAPSSVAQLERRVEAAVRSGP